MAVTVRFVDGTERTFAAADSSNRGPVFVVSKWNTKRRHLDEVAAFECSIVTLAEVTKGGTVTQIILGAGKRQPSASDDAASK